MKLVVLPLDKTWKIRITSSGLKSVNAHVFGIDTLLSCPPEMCSELFLYPLFQGATEKADVAKNRFCICEMHRISKELRNFISTL